MKSYNLYKSKEISDTGEKEGECNMDLDIGRLVLAAAIIFFADVLLSETGRLEHGKSED